MKTMLRLICLFGLIWPALAAAQDYPNRTIRFVVPFPAGGPADTMSRIVAEKLVVVLGQPVVIENRVGAGGITGTASVAKAEPDGYTIGIAGAGNLAINVGIRDNMPYHSLRDLTLVTHFVSVPELLVVGEQVPAKTLTELVALAKSQPGKLAFASTGHGGMPHLAMELLKITAQIDVVHVPYTGAAPAVNDLLGGHVQMMFADLPVLLANVASGKLRAIALGGRTRSNSLPAVPTTGELGMPQVEADNWYGLVAPPGLPPAVAAKLHAAVVEALRAPDVKERLAALGATPIGNSTEEFTAHVKGEIERWGKVAQAANIKIK